MHTIDQIAQVQATPWRLFNSLTLDMLQTQLAEFYRSMRTRSEMSSPAFGVGGSTMPPNGICATST